MSLNLHSGVSILIFIAFSICIAFEKDILLYINSPTNISYMFYERIMSFLINFSLFCFTCQLDSYAYYHIVEYSKEKDKTYIFLFYIMMKWSNKPKRWNI